MLTALYELKYTMDRQLKEIVLHPVEMGMDFSTGKGVMNRFIGSADHKYIDGSPRLATGASGQEILRRLKYLCELRGTTMEIRGNVGVIRL